MTYKTYIIGPIGPIGHIGPIPVETLKHKRGSSSARYSWRSESTLKVFAVKKIIYIPEEADLSLVITQGQGITSSQIGLRKSFESIATTHERNGIKDRSDVFA